MSTFIGMGANAPKKNIEAELKSRIAELEKELETAIADKNKAEKELKIRNKNLICKYLEHYFCKKSLKYFVIS